MNEPIIKTEHLEFHYTDAEGVTPIVLDGVDLEIRQGSFVAVLGHNGSGKSTLAKHLNAVLLPTGGKVTWDELGLPCTESGMALPCGATGRWVSE